jgi:hypothetical protein
MDDFLGNLAAKSLGFTPILQPRPMSRFEPWPANDVLVPLRSAFDTPFETERVATRIETGPSTLPRENPVPVQTQPDPLHDEPHHHDGETPPRAPSVQPFSSSEPRPAVTQQAALMLTPHVPAVSDEAVAPAHVDPSGATHDGRVAIAPRALSLAQPTVEQTERDIVEHEPTARKHEATPAAGKPTMGSVPLPLVPAPVIEAPPFAERTECDIVEHELTARKHEARPVTGKPIVSSELLPRVPAPVIETQPLAERAERDIVEHEQTARKMAPATGKLTVGSASLPRVPTPVIEAQPTAEQTPAQRAVVERERSDRGRAVQPSPARSLAAALPAPITADVRGVAHPIVTPIIERIERVREKPDGGEDARSGVLRTSQPLSAASRPASEPQLPAPPTIHITIGHIEVRATPPPAPVKRMAPAPPTMSLEEYLGSHAGNRR